jgi:hypothetical protein
MMQIQDGMQAEKKKEKEDCVRRDATSIKFKIIIRGIGGIYIHIGQNR